MNQHPPGVRKTGETQLRRTLTLPLVVLYGLGVTIGAGIYVLVGEVAGRAGVHAPFAFIVAGLVMLFPAASYAELAGRLPFAAGEVHFVEAGFGWPLLGLVVGLAVTSIGIISCAAIALGAAGYISELITLPRAVVLAAVIVAMGAVAAVGIRESIAFAGLFTVIEIGGLLAVIVGGIVGDTDVFSRLPETVPAIGGTGVVSGILAASLLAFFAFVGFENIDSVAEETLNPQRTLAWGIFITLGLSVISISPWRRCVCFRFRRRSLRGRRRRSPMSLGALLVCPLSPSPLSPLSPLSMA